MKDGVTNRCLSNGRRARAIKTIVTGVICAGFLAMAMLHIPAVMGDESAEQQAVLRANGVLKEALEKGDKKQAGELLDADFSWTDSAGKLQTKEQVLQMLGTKEAPKPAIEGTRVPAKQLNYGQVGVIEENSGRLHAVHVWVKRPAGWRELVYQEVKALDAPAVTTPGAGKNCENPCSNIPFEPKNDAERGVVAGYVALETAAVTHDAAGWASHVGDEFVAASSNSDQLLDKKSRVAGLEREKMGGLAPTALVSARMFDFGDAVVMTSLHQPERGNHLHVTRVWVKRDGKWLEMLSYQTAIQGSSDERAK